MWIHRVRGCKSFGLAPLVRGGAFSQSRIASLRPDDEDIGFCGGFLAHIVDRAFDPLGSVWVRLTSLLSQGEMWGVSL